MSDASIPLEYKVIELSLVDERSLEQTVNHWVGHGWRLENVQFAMRESSRRPSMAFVFFIREQASADRSGPGAPTEGEVEDRDRAQARLERLASRGDTLSHATAPEARRPEPQDAWARLRQLAGEEAGDGDADVHRPSSDGPPEDA